MLNKIKEHMKKKRAIENIKKISKKILPEKELIKVLKEILFNKEIENYQEYILEIIEEETFTSKEIFIHYLIKQILSTNIKTETKKKIIKKIIEKNNEPVNMLIERDFHYVTSINNKELQNILLDINKEIKKTNGDILYETRKNLNLKEYIEKILNEELQNKSTTEEYNYLIQELSEKLNKEEIDEKTEYKIWKFIIDKIIKENADYLKTDLIAQILNNGIVTGMMFQHHKNFLKIIEQIEEYNIKETNKIKENRKKDLEHEIKSFGEEPKKEGQQKLLKQAKERVEYIKEKEYINFNKELTKILLNFSTEKKYKGMKSLVNKSELIKKQVTEDNDIEVGRVLRLRVKKIVDDLNISLINLEEEIFYDLNIQLKEIFDNLNKLKELSKEENITHYISENGIYEYKIKPKIEEIIKDIIQKNRKYNFSEIIEEMKINIPELDINIDLEEIIKQNKIKYYISELTGNELKEKLKTTKDEEKKLIYENNFEAIEELTEEKINKYKIDIKKIIKHRSINQIQNIAIIENIKKLEPEEQLEIGIYLLEDKEIENILNSNFLKKLLENFIEKLPEEYIYKLFQKCPHIEKHYERKEVIKQIKKKKIKFES